MHVSHARRVVLAAVPLLAVVACSGTAGQGIPPSSDEINAGPVEVPKSGTPAEPLPDAGGGDADPPPAEDAGLDSGPDARADGGKDGGAFSCSACLAAPAPAGCKAEQDACMSHAICKLLDACLDACLTAGCRTACFTQYPDAEAKARNGALYKCQCTTTCAASCKAECN
ncbi:MAG: hypothetical protein JST00_45430 [Deltaproteobacteria bacterium]|nr:hypothetical protein [Deltaproteobacteria bacterium]